MRGYQPGVFDKRFRKEIDTQVISAMQEKK